MKRLENDDEILSLEAEIRVITARLEELIQRTGTGECVGAWKKIRGLIGVAGEIVAAIRDEDVDVEDGLGKLTQTNRAMSDVIASAVAMEQAWHEFYDLAERRAKLSRVEWQRLLEAKIFITPEQSAVFQQALLEAIRKHVTDKEVRAAIAAELVLLIR